MPPSPTSPKPLPPHDYPTSAFALDAGAFQIIRYTDTSAPNPQWLRFGIQRQPDGAFTPFVSHDIFLFKPEEAIGSRLKISFEPVGTR